MKHLILFFTILSCFIAHSEAQTVFQNKSSYFSISQEEQPLHFIQQQPLHEIRAVWLTVLAGLDWPDTMAKSVSTMEKQKKELTTILDKLQKAGINTVLFHTRIRATTVYPSAIEPWAPYLSGTAGKSPGYDVLKFAIDECHKRGMQLHAWVVTIPVGKWNDLGCKTLRQKYKSMIKKIGDEGFMNPESSFTSIYLARLCTEITRNYDIDGIHLDYIRYPETWGTIKNKDQARDNITRIVRAIHDAVKAEKKWVMMSCSPIGKYADLPRQKSGGWNARNAVCQDAALWMHEGLMDAIFPMMYFRGNNFYPFAMDWKERSNGRFVVPGLGIYFMSPKEKNWPLTDITAEMYMLRQAGLGHCYFRSRFFTDNTKGLYDFAKDEFCAYPSLIPAMTWYGYNAPDAPTDLKVDFNNDGYGKLTWHAGKDYSDGSYLLYNVYASHDWPVDTKCAKNLLVARLQKTEIEALDGCNYAVTAVDRYGNESEPVSINNVKITRDFVKTEAKIQKANSYLRKN